MVTMNVTNGYQAKLYGLGEIVPLPQLSQKRITKAAREALRKQYGRNNVTVSCSAKFTNNKWVGKCSINQANYNFEIYE